MRSGSEPASDTMPPIVSVLVAAYNAEPRIAEALASVTGPTHKIVQCGSSL